MENANECVGLNYIETLFNDNKFNEDGYLVLERFLEKNECEELLRAGIEFTNDLPNVQQRTIFCTNNPNKQHLTDEYFLKSNDSIRYFFEKDALNPDASLKVDHAVALNKVGHALHFLHPIFRKYTYDERVKTLCRKLGLIDPAVVQSMYIYKNPGIGGEVVPHQDATYLYTEPIPATGFWIALEDATIENGCLWLAKGSHTTKVHKRLLRNLDGSGATTLVYDKDFPSYEDIQFTAVPVKKGTCIVLHGLVVHKSAYNKSNKSRHAYTFHVIEKENNEYSPRNWLLEGPKAPFISLYSASSKIH